MTPIQLENKANTNNIHWIYWLAWLTLLAGICVPTAWGAPTREVRDRDDERRDRHERTERRDNRSEIDFMQQLMDQERSAIEIARIGRARSSHNDMRTFFEGVESAGQRRIERLSGWLGDWYGVRYTPTVTPIYSQQADVLNSRRVRSDEFEIRVLKVTANQHQDEAALCDRYQSRLEHRELRDLVSTIADKRTRDIKQLTYWLKTWYDISYSPQAPQPY